MWDGYKIRWVAADVDKDGIIDLILAGNEYQAAPNDNQLISFLIKPHEE